MVFKKVCLLGVGLAFFSTVGLKAMVPARILEYRVLKATQRYAQECRQLTVIKDPAKQMAILRSKQCANRKKQLAIAQTIQDIEKTYQQIAYVRQTVLPMLRSNYVKLSVQNADIDAQLAHVSGASWFFDMFKKFDK